MKKLLVGLALFGVGMTVAAPAVAEPGPGAALPRHVVVPQIASGDETPTPAPTAAPTPVPYPGVVVSMYLGPASVSSAAPIEVRDTTVRGEREVLQDPTAPGAIAWYERFGHPGYRGNNSVFAGHVNYAGYGNGPFAYLTRAAPGDALYLTMENGDVYAYTVQSVRVIPLAELDSGGMEDVVYPGLAAHIERATLISCGGDFVPYRDGSGAGEYTSRVVLVADRYVP